MLAEELRHLAEQLRWFAAAGLQPDLGGFALAAESIADRLAARECHLLGVDRGRETVVRLDDYRTRGRVS